MSRAPFTERQHIEAHKPPLIALCDGGDPTGQRVIVGSAGDQTRWRIGGVAQARQASRGYARSKDEVVWSMKTVPFAEVADILMGQSPDGATYNKSGNGLPLLNGPAEFGQLTPTPVQWTTTPAKIAEMGDILFCVRGNIGRQNIADQRYAIGRGLAAIRAKEGLADTEFIALWLQHKAKELLDSGTGSTFPNISGEKLEAIEFPIFALDEQRHIAARLKAQLAAVEEARQAAQAQLSEVTQLANAFIRQSLAHPDTEAASLGEVLEEVKHGIGATWADYPVLGATRDGLAPAKEPVGKQPERYKPVTAGTVFYNPMRIMT